MNIETVEEVEIKDVDNGRMLLRVTCEEGPALHLSVSLDQALALAQSILSAEDLHHYLKLRKLS